MIANDPVAQARLYRADAISMPGYQPALYGGLRLWRPRAGGSLELFRQIATHDHGG